MYRVVLGWLHEEAVGCAFQLLPSGSFVCFMGDLRNCLRWPVQRNWKRSSRTLKGSAVKLVQHTHQPLLDLFIYWVA
jgi:hypothetical protein